MKCAYCRKEVTEEHNKDRLYCSHRCGAAAYRRRIQTPVYQAIGSTCAICGSPRRIIMHEKSGKSHASLTLNTRKGCEYVLSHKEEFVPLCYKCHSTLHWVARNFKIKPFIHLLKLL